MLTQRKRISPMRAADDPNWRRRGVAANIYRAEFFGTVETGKVKAWTGTAWVACRAWTGTQWRIVKAWTGSAWV